MENFNKYGWVIAVIIAIIAPSFYTGSSLLGGASDSGYNATASGVYAVDGTTVIDGSGNWVGTIASASAITTTDDNISINGVNHTIARDNTLTAATTTVCAIQSPAATSTLMGGGLLLTVSSTTASTVTIAKAANAFATTTLIREASVSANAQASILAASTTLSALEQTNRIFEPSYWLVFGMSGGTGTFSPTGVCTATFAELD